MAVVNKKEFEKIRKILDNESSEREKVIKISREIRRSSKKSIYEVQKNNFRKAKKYIDDTGKKVKEVNKIIKKHPSVSGSANPGLEEYSEAVLFYNYVKNNKIVSFKDINVDEKNYLSGMADFTGELVREATQKAIENNTKKMKEIRKTVDSIFEQFLQFDFENGILRKKRDSIKWNLKRLQEMEYDLEIKKKK
ncbi:hypothetical protein JW949_04535 [Candidatus Woesearchaeota archaeon]|nr:hypothetical protein [Candidatus Woesearchaeota archaeon]